MRIPQAPESLEAWLGFPDPARCTCGEGRVHRRSDATVVDWSLRAPSPAAPATLAHARCATGHVLLENYFVLEGQAAGKAGVARK